MVLEFKRSETVFGVRDGFVECQPTGLKLGKQRIRIGDQNESIPSRPLVSSVIGYWKRTWCNLFKKNPHVITTHFEISFLEIS